MKELRFVTDCVNRVAHGDLISPADLPENLPATTKTKLRKAKHLLVEGIEQGPRDEVVLHVVDAYGPMSAVAIAVKFQPGEYVEQSRKTGEPNYRAPNGTFWVF